MSCWMLEEPKERIVPLTVGKSIGSAKSLFRVSYVRGEASAPWLCLDGYHDISLSHKIPWISITSEVYLRLQIHAI